VFTQRGGPGPARTWPVAIFVLTLAFYLAWLPRVLRYSSPPTGDQPFYLMDMASLAQDRDLNVKNNYDDADYDKFYALAPHAPGFVGMSAPYPLPRQLAPDTVRPASEQYSHHLPGLALLLLPAWKIGSWVQMWWPATMVAMCVIGALVGLNVFLLGYQVTGRTWIALATWLAVSFSSPLMTHSYLIFTELPVGLLLVYSFRRLSLGFDRNEWDRLLLVGLCIGFVPWLAWRCVLLTVTLAAYGLVQWGRAPAGRRRIVSLWSFLLPLLASAASLIAFHFFLYGRLYPAARVPELAGRSPFHWPWGGWDELTRFASGALALLFDRDFGLLPWAPVYAMALPGTLMALRAGRQEARRLLLAASLVVLPYVATLAAFEFWHGIWCPPARYLASIAPLLAAPLALALSPSRKGWRGWASPVAFAVLSLAGFALMGLVLRDPHFLWPGGDRGALPWRDWIPSFLRPDEVRQPLVLGAWLAAVLLLAALFSRAGEVEARGPQRSMGRRAALTGLLVAAAPSWWLASHEYLRHKTVLTELRRWSLGLPLQDPHGIAYAGGKVYVACYGERSASGDTAPGEVIEQDLGTGETRRLRPRRAGGEAAWSQPGDVKLGRDGLLYVLNNGPGDQALLALRNGAEVVGRAPLPATSTGAKGLEIGPDGTVYVTDMPGGQIVGYQVDDSGKILGSRVVAGGLMNPSGVALDEGGRIYVAQTYEWVQQLAADGTPLARLTKCSANSFAASSSATGWIEGGCNDSVFSINTRESSVQMARVAPGGRPIQPRISGMTYGPDGTLYVLQGDTLVSYRVRH